MGHCARAGALAHRSAVTVSSSAVSAFHKIIANVRSALEHRPHLQKHADGPVHESVPLAPAARRAELASEFAREVERVNGRFIGVLSLTEARDQIVATARELEAKSVTLGESVALDLEPIAKALDRAGITVIRAGKTSGSERLALRARIANCDLGIAEAHYGIASTGTFAVVATPGRPSSLTLLPPANFIIVDADRILPDLAAVLSALGTETIVNHRVALITGPSRTADIEKMIVLGVHGPKKLFAAAVWKQ
jgi:L-lactate dehydrogenase complex protein LldG